MQDRFSAKTDELITLTFDFELNGLHQKENETLSAYYKRMITLMKRVNARDRPISATAVTSLTLIETAVLEMIMKAFVRSLYDEDVQQRTTEGLAASDKSLRGVFAVAETARKTKMKLKKMIDEKEKLRKLRFYKSLVQKNMIDTQIETLLTTYDRKPATS